MYLINAILLALPASASLLDASRLFIRAAPDQQYLDSMCSPNMTNPSTIPPCISITNIQTICRANSTSSSGYAASAQCLCSPPSTFFQDWLGCRKCLQVHGGLNEQEYNQYSNVLDAASSSFCSGTPTTDFAAVFASAKATGAVSGATTTSDQFPSSSDVILYYTASGKQGAGSFTPVSGSAGATTLSSSLETGVSAGLPTATEATTSSSSPASTTARNDAGVTGAPLKPLALAIAAGVAVAVL